MVKLVVIAMAVWGNPRPVEIDNPAALHSAADAQFLSEAKCARVAAQYRSASDDKVMFMAYCIPVK